VAQGFHVQPPLSLEEHVPQMAMLLDMDRTVSVLANSDTLGKIAVRLVLLVVRCAPWIGMD